MPRVRGHPALLNTDLAELHPPGTETLAALDLPLVAPLSPPTVYRPAQSPGLADLLQAGWVQVLLSVAAALPLLWPQMPPLTDLGGHLGGFAVQMNGARGPADAALGQWYSFHWHLIPNLGTDLLMQLLAPVMGLEPALKTITIAIALLQAGGFLTLAKVVHGRLPPTTLLALPLVYSYPFEYGFLNYCFSTALATWALALWIHLDQPELRAKRWLPFVPIATALWVCHFAGWALFCTFAAGAELARWQSRGVSWKEACLRAAPQLTCLLAPCLLFALWPPVAHSPAALSAAAPGDTTFGWFDIPGKLGMIIMAMRDRWSIWDVASALGLVGVIGWTWRSRRFAQHPGLTLGVLLVGVAFVLVPKHVGGTSFVDMRLVPMILGVALIAVRPRAGCGRRFTEWLALAALVFCGARFAGNAASMVLLSDQFAQDLAVLNSLPRNVQLVTLTLKPCGSSTPWARERRTHLAGYALARRHDFSNDQWLGAGAQLLSVHNPIAGPFLGDPSETVTASACLGTPGLTGVVATVPQAIPYLWIIDSGAARDIPGWTPIRSSPGSVLYMRSTSSV